MLTQEQRERYQRNIRLPEIGEEGQEKLLASSVLLVGAGGLGSPAALYLACAGVGRVGLIDADVVDLSNLQRQILHHTNDVGRPKVVSAKESINELTPDVTVDTYPVLLSSDNALDIIKNYDVVLNCPDNFPTRYLVNDACVLAKKPLVDGSIFLFDGQATTFLPGHGCYRCLYPAPPPAEHLPITSQGPLGAIPGTIGSIQATEAIKVLLDIGEPLVGRLLIYDGLNLEFRLVRVRKDPACAVCGREPTIRDLKDPRQPYNQAP